MLSRTAFLRWSAPVSALILLASPNFLNAQTQPPPVGEDQPPAAQQPASPAQASPGPTTAAGATTPPQTVGEILLKNLKARSIGPATMGGRISDIALDPRNPALFYIGASTGGVFKTSNNGISFEPIFDKEPVQSIGAVAIAPSDSDVLWVGTGEANDRNSSGWGNGVYRSTDGGESWTHVGLPDSRAIARILVHPTNPEIAYVAASGHLWADGGQRGLYKTTDGGKNWQLVLRAAPPHNTKTGCCDVVMDPSNPEILYAALYARQRTPWSFTYGVAFTGGQDVGGIFKTTDGGATWRKLTNGLPGQTGRIGLAIAASNPKIVMAVVQSDEGGPSDLRDIHSKRGGIFRTEDGGDKWTRVNSINPRPFYFSQIRLDPASDQRVYVLGYAVLVSDDGGRSFREDLFEKVHPDCHALVIQPGSAPPPKPPKKAAPGAGTDPEKDKPKPPVSQRLLLGTDGGVYQTFQAGKNWDLLNRFPAGQFYHVTVDDTQPFYRVAGGLQDNCNWLGVSATQSKEGIRNSEWTNLGGGDGFYVAFDSKDKDVLYVDSQQGAAFRINLRTGEAQSLKPDVAEGQPRYRFHWNSPLLTSKHDPGALFLAGNRVFKLTEKGEHSAVISPDLTRNDPARTTAEGSGAESYGVVYAFAESPRKAGLLWAGTDDGRLWVTQNEGRDWTELTSNLPEPARGVWVNRIEPSAHDPNVAYVVFSAYRAGNDAPLIFRTADLGKSWQSVTGDLPANGPAQVVREDPVNPRLLYAGTEFGLFASFDAGAHWIKIGGLPTVPVHDLVIHPRTGDLVIATHGRSLYILDDARPLRELTSDVLAKPAHLFSVRPTRGAYLLPGWAEWGGKGDYHGENPAEGALFTVWVKEFTGDEIRLRISNAAGQAVANLKAAGAPGISRLNWDLRPTKEALTPYGGDDPKKLVAGGEYTAELSFGKTKVKQTFRVDVDEGIRARGMTSGEDDKDE